ncbi:hypothetical protein F7R25_03995 [Burkholderia stagnalis]|uniref:Uncharacterized protein n=1 Tax=Burkholderia stagnalis TaxID=1503054 RepID=A0A6L3N306_9BURK|nr:hypothetical protein [Burkholderia stagnalis]KAB0640666.1 hypothetical protein F7R25_03995 [Burkholderia stagnalis]VWB06234.1 hypothetical protein BST28156_00109 [Burkholderia stagnalis]
MKHELVIADKICHIGTTKESDMILVSGISDNFIKVTILVHASDNGDKQLYRNTGKVVLYGINQITRLVIEEDIEIQQ